MCDEKRFTVQVTCPWCQTSQAVLVKASVIASWEIYHCDVEYGGCDRPFVVKSRVYCIAETYQIAIPEFAGDDNIDDYMAEYRHAEEQARIEMDIAAGRYGNE